MASVQSNCSVQFKISSQSHKLQSRCVHAADDVAGLIYPFAIGISFQLSSTTLIHFNTSELKAA